MTCTIALALCAVFFWGGLQVRGGLISPWKSLALSCGWGLGGAGESESNMQKAQKNSSDAWVGALIFVNTNSAANNTLNVNFDCLTVYQSTSRMTRGTMVEIYVMKYFVFTAEWIRMIRASLEIILQSHAQVHLSLVTLHLVVCCWDISGSLCFNILKHWFFFRELWIFCLFGLVKDVLGRLSALEWFSMCLPLQSHGC